MLSHHDCVFLRGLNVNGKSMRCTNTIMIQERAPSLRTGKGNHKVDAAIQKLILMLVTGKVICNITLSVESRKHIYLLFLLVSLSFCLPPPYTHTQTHTVSDGHNSKVMGALERVVSYHTSVVQHSSQVRRDAVGSAC